MHRAEPFLVKSALEGKPVEKVIEEMGIIPEAKLAEAKAKILGVPFISLTSTSFAPQAIGFLPRAVVERFSLIPFFYDEKAQVLYVAMANPVDLEAIEFVKKKTGLNIKTFAAAPSEVQAAINQEYRQELVGEVGAAIKESEEFSKKKNSSNHFHCLFVLDLLFLRKKSYVRTFESIRSLEVF